jgi:hypothetical protein
MNQDLDTQARVSTGAITLCGKSWTAYVGIALRAVLLLVLCSIVIYRFRDYWQIAALILLVGFVFIAYQVMLLHSVRLYYDDAGVWIYSGILPWKRGVAGVKWRDLDEATFANSFWSWISGSYTVQLKHRFTKALEIGETNMARGKQAVVTINQQLQQRISQEAAPRSASPGAI